MCNAASGAAKVDQELLLAENRQAENGPDKPKRMFWTLVTLRGRTCETSAKQDSGTLPPYIGRRLARRRVPRTVDHPQRKIGQVGTNEGLVWRGSRTISTTTTIVAYGRSDNSRASRPFRKSSCGSSDIYRHPTINWVAHRNIPLDVLPTLRPTWSSIISYSATLGLCCIRCRKLIDK